MLITKFKFRLNQLCELGIEKAVIAELEEVAIRIQKDIATNNLISAVNEIGVLKAKLKILGLPAEIRKELMEATDSIRKEIVHTTHVGRGGCIKNLCNILVVDDSEDNRKWVRAVLYSLPFNIDIADNGAVAIEKFKANSYDIILMDVQMPIMNGYMVTASIRKLEQENHFERTPIIAWTASVFPQARERSLEMGCDDHLGKPVEQQVLIDVIIKHIFKGCIYNMGF